MNSISSILVIVDPTADAHPSVVKASRLAAKLGARLELYICDTKAARETRLTMRSAEPYSRVMNLKPVLEDMAAGLRRQGLDVAVDVEFGDPLADKLIAKVKAAAADLVVKDTHHHSLLRRTFLSNTDWQLIRACPVPLLLTKPTPWADVPTILAAVDPGHVNDKPALLDELILQYGSCIARNLNGELHVVHAFVPVAVIAAATSGEPAGALAISEEDAAREQQASRGAIAAMATPFGVGDARIHVPIGGPVQVLPDEARRLHADIAVMGALSRRGVKRAFLGSTAEDVLEYMPCDELIVKPPDFSEALAGMCP